MKRVPNPYLNPLYNPVFSPKICFKNFVNTGSRPAAMRQPALSPLPVKKLFALLIIINLLLTQL